MANAMTAYSIYEVVREYAGLLGLKIAPHDLRRTHAKLAYNGGSRLEQIQLALGHASVQTTERYLGTEQDFGAHLAIDSEFSSPSTQKLRRLHIVSFG